MVDGAGGMGSAWGVCTNLGTDRATSELRGMFLYRMYSGQGMQSSWDGYAWPWRDVRVQIVSHVRGFPGPQEELVGGQREFPLCGHSGSHGC